MDHSVDEKSVEKHFDSLAGHYDGIKNKNRYYSRSLKKFIAEVIPPGSRVLEVGTATGEVLNFLKPSKGTGIDLSSNMIQIARSKFAHLDFACASLKDFQTPQTFDYILLADVIEHLENPQWLFPKLRELSGPHTRVVLTMANPAWEPLLELLERFKLKMEEGPHFRILEKDLIRMAEASGFRLVSEARYLLFPIHIPILSPLLNDVIGRLPFIRHLAVIERFVFEQALSFHERRIASEINHGRKIAPQAEKVWNWEGPINQVRYSRRIQFLCERLKPGIRVLELGCGTGLFTEGLAKVGTDLTSIDISPDLLKKATHRVPTGKFIEQDICQTEFSDNHFDAVIGSSVLHHLDTERSLREIFRVLKPGGQIRFTEPNFLNPHVFLELRIPYLRNLLGVSEYEIAFVRQKLSDQLHKAGFIDIRVEPFDFLYPFLPDSFLPLLKIMGSVLERIPIIKEIAGSLQITAAKA